MRPSTVLPVLLFALLAGLFGVALFSGDPSEIPSPLIGKPVPAFSLPPLEGSARPGLSAEDLAQGRASIVNVWASWCVPCRQEHPLLMGLSARGIPVHGLNYKDGAESARRFLDEMGNPFDRIGVDATGRVSIDWGVYGVPETFLVDGAGKILFKQVGPLNIELIEQELLPRLARAEAAPPSAGN